MRKGQPLIQLENSEARAEVERAQANRTRATLTVPAQQAAVLRAQAALSAAEAAVARAKANRTLALIDPPTRGHVAIGDNVTDGRITNGQ